MPYFSFRLKKNFFNNNKFFLDNYTEIKEEKTYFSKSTSFWNKLNKIKNSEYIDYLKYEKRHQINKLGEKIIFCLPPNIGMGDALEYALSIKSILTSNKFKNLAVSFVGKYSFLFKKYFDIQNIFPDFISKNELQKYDTIFHFSLEIKSIKNQKYIRSDIEENINNYFKISKYRKNLNIENKPINKITLFPISRSPIRSMSLETIKKINNFFNNNFLIEIILDKSSKISDYLNQDLENLNVKKIYPKTLIDLCNIIENIENGVFMDSGPLHLAKILSKKGLLITSSVDSRLLLNNFHSISVLNNHFKSDFCNAPCGLTDIFNYNNNIGCYQTLKIQKDEFLKLSNTKDLQRGNIKNMHMNFLSNPVGCIENINIKSLIKKISKDLDY